MCIPKVPTTLVETGEQWSKSLGCNQIALDTELDNYTSQEFHKKIGFKRSRKNSSFY
ncbi:GNAT family N-acetyltransferase [Fontibacillus panacisegetis]|uniref:GNAT family N-acetyltransferase n=1 Tax=Fontibacillus panacisegetis TaxID=670482 RepID=UPI003CCB9488